MITVPHSGCYKTKYKESRDLNNLIANMQLSSDVDSWNWKGYSTGVFSVKSLRVLIDNKGTDGNFLNLNGFHGSP